MRRGNAAFRAFFAFSKEAGGLRRAGRSGSGLSQERPRAGPLRRDGPCRFAAWPQGAAGRSAASRNASVRDAPVFAIARLPRATAVCVAAGCLLAAKRRVRFLSRKRSSEAARVLPVILPFLNFAPRRPASEAGRGRFSGEAVSASRLRPRAGSLGMLGCAGRPTARKACRLAGRGGRAVRRWRFGYWESRIGRVL